MRRSGTFIQRGFTLIELLIVIAILTILALLGFPRYTQYRTDALVAEIQGTGTVIGRAAEAWAATHSEALGSFDQNTSLNGYLKNDTLDRLDEYTVAVTEVGVRVTYTGSAIEPSPQEVYNTTSN